VRVKRVELYGREIEPEPDALFAHEVTKIVIDPGAEERYGQHVKSSCSRRSL